MSSGSLVSVIVPTRNSARTLEQLLRSAKCQSPAAVELIVVDNHSTDDTVEIAVRYADQLELCGPERSAQRNRGAALATGEYLLFVDADMELRSGAVAACLTAAHAAGAAAVVVPERTVGRGFVARCRALERRCYEGDMTIEAARFFERDAFVRHGGYDESLTGPEDWDLPARMRAAGDIVARANDAMIEHDEDHVALRAHLHKKYTYGKSFGRYVRRHPELALAQLSPVRPALVRNWRLLAAKPALGVGVVGLKMADFIAGGLGLATASLSGIRPRRAPIRGVVSRSPHERETCEHRGLQKEAACNESGKKQSFVQEGAAGAVD